MATWIPVRGLKVAVDGPSGSGKGTAAAMLASRIGLPVFDTGLLYRYAGVCAEQRGANLDSAQSVLEVIDACFRDVAWLPEGLMVKGERWNGRLRSEEAGTAASKVASIPEVRQRLLGLQQKLSENGCVMDGRDIGTEVLPDAQAKFFLTASIRERARRRCLQLQQMGAEASLDAVIADMRSRDARDSERRLAPLIAAEDAIRIDSTTLRPDEVIDRMIAILARRKLIRSVDGQSKTEKR